MFEKYFTLSGQPFGATPDPRFLLRTGSHREALASLYAGFYANRGFTVLIAEPGMGKTTLLFEFLEHIRGTARTIFLFDTLCEPADVLSLILQELGLTPRGSAAERHRQLNEVLIAEARADRRVVLVIDEAQNLSLEALEAVRLLNNFETSRSKLMQVILSGQPELADKLARPEAVQLRQRVSTICRLTRFTAAEANAYIQQRLELAGHNGGPIFTPSALHALAEASQGIPRVINTLCFNSLCLCMAKNKRIVDEPAAIEAITDLRLPTYSAASNPDTLAEIPALVSLPLPVVARIPDFSEMQISARSAAHYFVAILLVLCIGLLGVSWRADHNNGYRLHSALAAVFHIWPKDRTSQGVNIPHLQPSRENLAAMASAQNKPQLIAAVRAEEVVLPKQLVVAPGESLETIARNQLGTYDGHILHEIRELNPDITDPNHIEIGRTIRLPKRGGTDDANASARSQP